MFREYALEPSSLSSWDRVRFFLDGFGPWKGRFLARYPKDWRRMIFDKLDCPDVDKKRIEERLRRLDNRVFAPRPNAPYNEALPWLDNALRESVRDPAQPFHAIIAADANGRIDVLNAAEITDTDPRWRVEPGQFLRRDPVIIGDAVDLLLRLSSRVILIDPYFRAHQPDKTAMVVEFTKRLRARPLRLEVHFATECDRDTMGAEARAREHADHNIWCMDQAVRVLPRALPGGARVLLCGWRERSGGSRLHNRYLITDVGGVKFGDSLERGESTHDDHASLLDEPSRAKLWADYVGPAPAFDSTGLQKEFIGEVGHGHGRR